MKIIKQLIPGLSKTLLLIASLLSVSAFACTPAPLQQMAFKDVYRGICYGDAVWKEPSVEGHPLMQQVFDYFPVAANHPVPLVIWGHPNGSTHWLSDSSPLYDVLVQQARNRGFGFISLEFRHPVGNDNIVPAPHLDFAHAIQFIRANAKALNIDTNNIFLIGQSRGTLGLWTALQDDMADPTSLDINLRQSTRVNAVFGYQAQTTYDGREFADLFIIPRDRPLVKAEWEQEHPQYELFGSAIKSVDATDPPVMLRYEASFVGHLVSAIYMWNTDNTEHYPDMGPALCAAYQTAYGDRSHCHAEDQITLDQAFDGYINFFISYLR